MATALPQEDLLKCPICFEDFTKPRSLPECFHKFCESCLLGIIENTPIDGNSAYDFHCPVCRKQVEIPVSGDDLKDWVKSLESNQDMAAKETKQDNLCLPCTANGKTKSADKYCIECEEILCATCSSIIHAINASKGHHLIDFDQTIPGKKKETQRERFMEFLKCPRHTGRVISHICEEENVLCCIECIVDEHRLCGKIKDFKDKSIRPENEMCSKRIKGQMEKLIARIKSVTDFEKESNAELRKEVKMAHTKMRDIRDKVNSVLDALEENVSSEAKAILKKNTLETDERCSTLKDLNSGLRECSTMIEYAGQVGSDSHLFIILNKVNRKTREIESRLLDLGQSCVKREVNLRTRNILDKLVDIGPNDTGQLATVTEESLKVPMPDFPKKWKPTVESIKQVAWPDIVPDEADEPEFYSINYANSTNGLFLVETSCGVCCLTDEDYAIIASCDEATLSGQPYSGTCLKDGVFAVSLPEEKKICFLSEHKSEDESELRVESQVRARFSPKVLCGMTNGDIAVSCEDPVAFGIMTFKCSRYLNNFEEKVYFSHDKQGRALKSFDFMAVDEERSLVIQPCSVDKAVYGFDFEGKPKFVYTHKKLCEPRGVTCDGNGHIFICEGKRSSIHIIEHDGTGVCVVEDECPERPLAVCFNHSGTQFALTHDDGPLQEVYIFDVDN